MTDLSAWLLDLIARHSAWSAPIIGVLAFLESLLIVGLFVPAIALMVAVGGLIGAGIVDPAPVMVCAVVGAVLGDWVSFVIGERMGPAIYRHRLLKGQRLAFARARLFFRRYGFASVLIGRFLGPLRSTVPVVAGVVKMRRPAFQTANLLSAIIWVPALMAPGYFAGAQVQALGLEIEHILPIAAGVLLIPFLLGWIGFKILNKPRERRGGGLEPLGR